MMNRRTAIAATFAWVLLGASCARDSTGDVKRFLSIGTAGTGGVYYPLGGALASRLSEVDSLRRFTAEVSGGSVENIQRLMNGDIDIGFAIGTTVYEAYTGGQDFAAPLERLRIVAPLYPNLTHVLVPGSSTALGVGALRGKRVSVGSAGSGTEQLSRQLLEAYGLTYDDIEPKYLSFTESASALADGAIDAAIISVGYPASAVLEATTTGRARLMPLDSEVIRGLAEKYVYYSPGVIPAGTYAGVTAPVPTTSVLNWIIVRDDLADEIVTEILTLLSTRRDELRDAVDIAGQINLANLRAAPIPLHRAARAWLDRPTPRPDSAGPPP